MNLVKENVIHKVFGLGMITKQEEHSISVKFENLEQEKKFPYPSCFDGFITLCNHDKAKDIEKSVEEFSEKERKEQEEKREKFLEISYTKKLEKKEKSSTLSLLHCQTVEEFCNIYNQELRNEISYVRIKGGKRQKIFDGVKLDYRSGKYIYVFETDEEMNYPDGTPIYIWKNSNNMPGKIIGCEDFTIIIETKEFLGESVSMIEFSAEPWKLMQTLIDRQLELIQNPSKIAKMLICDGKEQIDFHKRDIAHGQETAVSMALQQPILFIWGPPGTGKTETLAKIAIQHIKLNHKVLMLSYSNVSVDGAIMRVHTLMEGEQKGKIIRYGYPRKKELLDHPFLTSYNLAIHKHPDLLEERNKLNKKRKNLNHKSAEYIQVSKSLSYIRNQMQEEEKKITKSAMFVATTVSKTIVDKELAESDFDVVIFDEASMAYIPQIIFAANLAQKHFICIGDFAQLPPIVQNSPESHLNMDIFHYCGIADAVAQGFNHHWLCMLNTQYRMHPEIADFASKFMYNNLLKSALNLENRRNEITRSQPIKNHAIGIADLTGMMSVCTKTTDNSRINILSAFITFSLAIEAAKEHEVGIITPYHAQSRIFHAMARDILESCPGLKTITSATVHQFQGSEKDIILYDAVDCYRMTHPGKLLTSTANNYANRLFNVALTRAKGKFIGVSNISYMQKKHLSNQFMFGKMLSVQKNGDSCLDGNYLCKSKQIENMTFYEGVQAYQAFIEDLKTTKKEIRIDIPNAPKMNTEFLKLISYLEQAKKSGISVIVRAEKKQNLPKEWRAISVENPYIVNPIVLVDRKIVWYGIPMSKANFFVEKKEIKTLYYPIIRFTGGYTAKLLYGFLEMNKILDQCKTVTMDDEGNAETETLGSYILATQKCPICGKPMQLKKSQKGKFFIACTGYPKCNQTELLSTEILDKYLYRHGGCGQRCPKCNSSMEAKVGKYGVYIQCCSYRDHRYRVDQI